jgi:hypothetical protein
LHKHVGQFWYVFFFFFFLFSLAKATYAAISRTYLYLTPDLWPEQPLEKTPYQVHADFLGKSVYKVCSLFHFTIS